MRVLKIRKSVRSIYIITTPVKFDSNIVCRCHSIYGLYLNHLQLIRCFNTVFFSSPVASNRCDKNLWDFCLNRWIFEPIINENKLNSIHIKLSDRIIGIKIIDIRENSDSFHATHFDLLFNTNEEILTLQSRE